MILEGTMIVLATVLLTAFHPGRAFGAKWRDAGWSWGKDRGDNGDTGTEMFSRPPSNELK